MNSGSSNPLPQKTRKGWLVFAVIALTALAALVAMRFRPTNNVSSAPPVTAIAHRAISCLGRIEPDFEVITLAAPSSNSPQPPLISALKIEEGDEVKAGQLIATLDNRDRLERAWQASVSQIKV